MVCESKIYRGGTEIVAEARSGVGAAQDGGEKVEDARAPRHAGGDAVGRAEAREGAASVQECCLLVTLKVGDGAPMYLIDRAGVQFERVSHTELYSG